MSRTYHCFVAACLLAALVSNNAPAQWVYLGQLKGVSVFASLGTNIYAGTGAGIYRSTDDGATWQISKPSFWTYDLITWGSSLVAGGQGGAIMSTDAGATWSSITDNSIFEVWSLAANHTELFMAANNYDVLLFTNNKLTKLITFDAVPVYIATSGANLVVATNYPGVFFSSDYFKTRTGGWSNVGLPKGAFPFGLGASGSNVFISTGYSGVYLSTDNGATWNPTANFPTKGEVSAVAFAFSGTNIIAATTRGLFLSSDMGKSWIEKLADEQLTSVCIHGNNIFVSNASEAIFRKPISEVTSVDAHQVGQPNAFALQQNFPNPFNPSTQIRFAIPWAAVVSLKVFDIVGRERANLLDRFLEAGTFELVFHAETLPSGVYLCRLQAGSLTATRKLIIQK